MMRGAHIRIPAALVVLALVAGCGDDDEPTRPMPPHPADQRPAAPTETTERPAPPAVPDGGLDRGHGVDDP
jgi:hypothetical protein